MNVAAIPLLYVFEADEAAWLQLESHLAELRDWWRDDRTEGGRSVDLYKSLYNIFNSKWRDLRYPIDSAGDPPWVRDPDPAKAKATERERRRLVNDARDAMVGRFEQVLAGQRTIGTGKPLNQVHTVPTWMFTNAPDSLALRLASGLARTSDEGCAVAHRLGLDNPFSAWAAYSGVGRSTNTVSALATVWETLLGCWDGTTPDKFLLAAISHPMGRRMETTDLLAARPALLSQVTHLTTTALDWLSAGRSDRRPGGRGQWALELRYTVFIVRGLLRVSIADPSVEVRGGTDLMRSMADRLEHLGRNRKLGSSQQLVRDLVDRTVPLARGEAGDVALPAGLTL